MKAGKYPVDGSVLARVLESVFYPGFCSPESKESALLA